ncbi:MAG: adenylosuccinate lyase [Simkaniaceae bacterium]
MNTISSVYDRYVSEEMLGVFSPHSKYSTWRKLWLELAKGQKKLGISISEQQLAEMQQHISSIDFEKVQAIEKKCKHEVMAHIAAFGEACPKAKKIIHLGATSSYVMDNADLILMKKALEIISHKLIHVIGKLASLSKKYAALPCLSYTHFQPAQPTTIGKRLAIWLQDLIMDFEQLDPLTKNLPFLGIKGATGTAASFLQLFDGDKQKVRKLDDLVTKAMGFSASIPLSTQTYPRKIDYQIFSVLSGLAATCHKIGTDIRLLSHTYEITEKSSKEQIGSSAMPHKQNPILSERLCSLSRFLLSLTDVTAYNAALQWLERSLDDSANRRLVIPQGFFLADSILHILYSIFFQLEFHEEMIQKHFQEFFQFIALEPILMHLAKQGKDRGQMHEILKQHARKAFQAFKEGKSHVFLQDMSEDPRLELSKETLDALLKNEVLTGLAEDQVLQFLSKKVDPLLEKRASIKTSMETVSL